MLSINVFGAEARKQSETPKINSFPDDSVSTKVGLPHRTTRVSTPGKVGLVTAEASEWTYVTDREVNKHAGPDKLRAVQASTYAPPTSLGADLTERSGGVGQSYLPLTRAAAEDTARTRTATLIGSRASSSATPWLRARSFSGSLLSELLA